LKFLRLETEQSYIFFFRHTVLLIELWYIILLSKDWEEVLFSLARLEFN